jgi:hypothetical protein
MPTNVKYGGHTSSSEARKKKKKILALTTLGSDSLILRPHEIW